jgi:DNA-binding NtrC family response regulator
VVDDNREQRGFFEEWLTRRGYDPIVTGSINALESLGLNPVAAVLAEVELDWGNGVDLCRQMSSAAPGIPVVLVTRQPSLESAVAALRAGAFDYLTRPLDLSQLELCLRRATTARAVIQEVKRLETTTPRRCDEMVGDSPPMRQLEDLIQRLAVSDVSVLITGETGVGKELVARAIHRRSRRGSAPFVEVDCAAMPEQLLESELFGHVRGAFTDAKMAHTGLLVHADAGTVFLDEIGDMPAGLQPKLLRVLQQRVVRPVGSTRSVPVDVRVIAATNRALELEVERGRFRHDLFFRLNVVQVQVPPLRQRGKDILLLAQHFVREFGAAAGKEILGITVAAGESLMAYPWPGNVRELGNCIERAVALTRYDHLTRSDLPDHINEHHRASSRSTAEGEPRIPSMVEVEHQHIKRVMQRVGGNKTLAARILGFDRKTLYRKLVRFGLARPSPPAG